MGAGRWLFAIGATGVVAAVFASYLILSQPNGTNAVRDLVTILGIIATACLSAGGIVMTRSNAAELASAQKDIGLKIESVKYAHVIGERVFSVLLDEYFRNRTNIMGAVNSYYHALAPLDAGVDGRFDMAAYKAAEKQMIDVTLGVRLISKEVYRAFEDYHQKGREIMSYCENFIADGDYANAKTAWGSRAADFAMLHDEVVEKLQEHEPQAYSDIWKSLEAIEALTKGRSSPPPNSPNA